MADNFNILDRDTVIAIGGQLYLYSDAANVLTQRNGASAQSYHLYNTYTDASNYERLGINWASNLLRIDAQKAGTGTQRHIALQTGGSGNVGIGTTNPLRPLQVYNPINNTTALELVGGGGSSQSRLVLSYGTASAITAETAMLFASTSEVSLQGLMANQPMRFHTNNTERVRITAGGNVLIGTTADDGTNKLQVTGPSIINTGGAANKGLIAKGAASQSGNLFEAQDSASTIYGTITENGYWTTRKTAAPADAELTAGELAFWFDATNGAAKAMFKAKQADGTVRTGSLALA